MKKNTTPINSALRYTYFFSVFIRINHGINAIHAKYPKSAGGKERHIKRIVKKEWIEIFIKFLVRKDFVKGV